MVRIATIIGLVIILSACGSGEQTKSPSAEPVNGQAQEEKSEGNENVAGEVELKVVSFTNDQAVIELQNQTEKPLELEFTSGQQYDMWIKNESGETVFHWGEGKMFTQALKKETIEPGGKRTFTVAIPELDPGTYNVRFKVTSVPSFETTFKQTI
ncbi:BsuPI-related putative proteinase inhibitor [Pseudalkalibacillus sp. SCS-8]|uniref:BsuPI-related putative proteinase inhibitor n=1 Tax=Pseudalkalibacillus nanhaiensis TaxID=3115291 RepID=UPI0032DBB03D